MESIKQSAGSSLSGLGVLRRSLVVIQVAFAMMLLVGGTIIGRSLLSAYAADFGFRPDRLLVASATARPQETVPTNHDTLARIAELPGVQSVAVCDSVPLTAPHRSIAVSTPTLSSASLHVKYNSVGPDYLRTLGIAVIGGREFNQADVETSAQVAIVSQELAAELWPHTDPLGQTILVGEGAREVIGVARDAKYESVWERTAPYLYLPSSGAASNVVVHTLVAPLSLEAPLRKALAPHAIIRFTTGSDLVNAALAPQRLSTLLLGSFATLAIILGSIGIGSALSYFVRRNTREIGVRLAIGASPLQVLLSVVAKALALAGLGVGVGGAVAYVAAPHLAFLAKEVDPRHPLPFAIVSLLILAIAAAAALGPALHAARIDPALALRRN